MKRAFFWGTGAMLAFVWGCGNGGTSDDSTGGGCALKDAANSEFCVDNGATLNCGRLKGLDSQVCGVGLPTPPAELSRSANVEEFHGTGAPQVDCFAPASYPAPPGASQPNVTVEGIAEVFAHGCDSADLTITYYTVVRDGSANDGKLGAVVGTAVITPSDCTPVGVGVKSDNGDCSDGRFECKYSYPNVPRETELAVKTEGAGKWSPLVQYNIYIPSSEVVDGKWSHDVRALATDDYGAIYAVAVGSPTPGDGALAGEVHDCGDVRLVNAVVNVDKANAGLYYFSDNEDDPLPVKSADATSTLGLYSAFDVPPGQVTVAAVGTLNGETVTLGQHHVYVYPDTVTSLTFSGLKPYQLPK